VNWQQKTVLVTGAGGFIGSHLAEALIARGAKVRAMVHYNALGKWGWLDASPVKDEMKVVAGDITDRDSVTAMVEGVDVVFHLAALIAIPYSYQAPASYVATNIGGTLNVLSAARQQGCERLVHTSTSEVYGTACQVPIREDHPLQGQSPYSASKIGADKMVEAFHCSFETPVVTVRPFNTFGPRQSARAVIPTIISQCLAGKDKIRLGNLTPTRDMNFVTNTAEGFIAAAEAPKAIGQTVNLGSGREISIGDLGRLIAELVGVNVSFESQDQRKRPDRSEVERLLADSSLAGELLGWTPSVGLEKGLSLTIDWLRKHMEMYRPDDYTV
jgi:NAD dependent epimerase/dehydratase